VSVATEADLIRRMLDEGQLARADEGGHRRELRAACPADRASAPVHRAARAGRKLIEVVFRCPDCGRDFPASPETMHLR
jgi:hypothetical protein